MACGLHVFKKRVITHYADSKGRLFPKKEWHNIGTGKMKDGMKDLPKDGYPYTFKYAEVCRFKCCQICYCADK